MKLTALVALTLLAGCLDSAAGEPVTESIEVEEIVLDQADRAALADLPGGDICACTSNACAEEFIDDWFGCDVCVAVECGDQAEHFCNPCPEDADPDAPDGKPVADDGLVPSEAGGGPAAG